jgi:hypothetical protein
VGNAAWTDERATRVATFAVVLALMSLLCSPIYGGAMLDSLHLTLGVSLRVSQWVALPLSMLAGVPAFVLATLAMARAHSNPFAGSKRARVARILSVFASVMALFAALASASSV